MWKRNVISTEVNKELYEIVVIPAVKRDIVKGTGEKIKAFEMLCLRSMCSMSRQSEKTL